MNEIFERNLTYFKVVKRYADKAQCVCPCHNDKQASLTISKGDRCVLLKCFAGCRTQDIVETVGLKMADLFYDAEPGKPKTNWKRYVESREKKKIEAVYNYISSVDGSYCFTKIRLEGKKILYGVITNERFTYGLPKGTSRKDFKAFYGNLEALKKAISDGKPIFIVEGEKDVDTLTKQGYTAFTYGGCSDWQVDFAELVRGADVFILRDNDQAGLKVAQTILNDVKNLAKSAKIINPVPDIPKADITDFFESGHTKEQFKELLNQDTITENDEVISPNDKVSLVAILNELDAVRNFETNDKGFGSLFAEVFKDKHRYNPNIKDFMLYDGKKWIEDVEGLSARADAKVLSDALLQYGSSIGDTDYLKAVTALCNIRNRNNMLQDSKDVYYFSNEELDCNDYLLNVQNGTLDLSYNEPKFLKHSPNMLLSKTCNVNYNPTAECKEWEKFLLEIMQGDIEKIKYLQKIAGLSLTGNTEQETCFILYGSTTRNGKSTFCETLIHLLGDYALTMKPESLAVKQNIDSRQASGDIARLAGCRFCNASEPPKRMLFDTALLKSLLGRDSITARHLHQREFSFVPKFKLVINTNYLPKITDDTIFASGRINVISFDRHFEPHEQDKHLKDRLRTNEEMSGILNWCIDGLYLYRQEGLEPPRAVQNATEVYRQDSDKIGTFINERLTKNGKNSSVKTVYDIYSEWCVDNGFGVENKGNFISELKTKGIYAISGTVDGKTIRNIVKGYSIEAEFVPCENNVKLPFDD